MLAISQLSYKKAYKKNTHTTDTHTHTHTHTVISRQEERTGRSDVKKTTI